MVSREQQEEQEQENVKVTASLLHMGCPKRKKILISSIFKLYLNKRQGSAWPSLAAPSVSMCGKARGSEEGRRWKEGRKKEKHVIKALAKY